jgi:RNA 2',3'-cyclic 3'-phosphodiesterase
MRLFCAIELPEEIRAAVASHVGALRRRFPGSSAKWERPEKLHVTVKFFGEISPARLLTLSAALASAARGRRLSLAFEGAGAFPPRGRARSLWIGVADAGGDLARLQNNLETLCETAGFARDARAFHPHVTTARLRGDPDDKPLVAAHVEMKFSRLEWTATEFVLLESVLEPRGSHYAVVARFPFTNAAAQPAEMSAE